MRAAVSIIIITCVQTETNISVELQRFLYIIHKNTRCQIKFSYKKLSIAVKSYSRSYRGKNLFFFLFFDKDVESIEAEILNPPSPFSVGACVTDKVLPQAKRFG